MKHVPFENFIHSYIKTIYPHIKKADAMAHYNSKFSGGEKTILNIAHKARNALAFMFNQKPKAMRVSKVSPKMDRFIAKPAKPRFNQRKYK